MLSASIIFLTGKTTALDKYTQHRNNFEITRGRQLLKSVVSTASPSCHHRCHEVSIDYMFVMDPLGGKESSVGNLPIWSEMRLQEVKFQRSRVLINVGCGILEKKQFK